MPDRSQQQEISLVRPPRVQITYEVDENGAKKDKHLPFVMGIMADLSADGEKNLPPLRERKFREVDRDNIDEVMADAAPTLSYTVDNTLTGEGQLRVNLKFSKLSDLNPDAVAEQIPALRELLKARRMLDEALSRLETNEQLGELLQEMLTSQEKVRQLAREIGLPEAADAPTTPSPEK